MRTAAHRTILIAVVLLLAGCGTIRMTVTSDPTGASIYADGKLQGLSPCDVAVPWSWGVPSSISIEARKPGCENTIKVVRPDVRTVNGHPVTTYDREVHVSLRAAR